MQSYEKHMIITIYKVNISQMVDTIGRWKDRFSLSVWKFTTILDNYDVLNWGKATTLGLFFRGYIFLRRTNFKIEILNDMNVDLDSSNIFWNNFKRWSKGVFNSSKIDNLWIFTNIKSPYDNYFTFFFVFNLLKLSVQTLLPILSVLLCYLCFCQCFKSKSNFEN